jgi:mRNA interferase YafQ
MGLSVSDAVRVFLMRVVAEKQLPFVLKVPNTETRAAMTEADQITRTRHAALQQRLNCSMTSKKTAASKRAPLPRAADYTKSFLKDWERLSRSGRYDMNRLKEAMLLLIANDGPLGPEWLDHALGVRLGRT